MSAAANRLRNDLPLVSARDRGTRIESLESRVLFAAGDLDSTFNGTGQLTLDYFGRNDFGNAVAVQADGKVLVAGTASTGTTTGTDVTVARFHADGTLDTTFGTSGRVVTHLGGTGDSAYALAVQADGRILLAGGARAGATATDFALVRYNADGTLDGTFGTSGIVRTDFGYAGNDLATSMTVLADGRIVLGGWSTVVGTQHFAAARYTSSGALDTSFGGDGTVVAEYGNGSGQAKAIAALADGSLVLAGTLTNYDDYTGDYAAVRLLADGTVDGGFGTSGWARVHLGGETESANAVVVTADGAVVLVGESSSSTQQAVGVARLTATGQLDGTFGGGAGFVLTNFAGGVNWGAAAALQADGKFLVAGSATVDGPARFAAARYNVDGTLDSTFGSGGTALYDFGAESLAKAMVLDGQGQIVIAGNVSAAAGNFNVGLVRIENAAPNTPPLAHAGGDYLVNAGDTIVLDGSGSSDVDGSIAAYEWDFDYDGSSFDVDATGAAPLYAAGAGGTRTLALRVTDNGGATSVIATALMTINAAPTAHAGGPYIVDAGGSITLDGGGSADVDGSIVAYEWDFDYDGSAFEVDAAGIVVDFTAPSASGGTTRTVALRCIDDRGAVTLTTTTVTINLPPPPPQAPGTALLVADPNAPGREMLSVVGTADDDRIRFRADRHGRVEVRLGSRKLGTFSGMTRIMVDAGAGDDVIDASRLSVPVFLVGGEGNDTLLGGSGDDALIGSAGTDFITGGRGRNVLVGGNGRDLLMSQQGNDLVLGGSITFQEDTRNMSGVLAEWSRQDRSLSQRVANLMNGGGRNGDAKLSGNLLQDGARDTLLGSPRTDWLLSGPRDRVLKVR